MPGVKIGDHCVVAAGTVVMRDVPSNSVIAGNPGRVLERDIQTGRFGIRSGPGFAKMDAA
jgi:acetyltransferase-like isoleucine patch superfamily enzyme